MARKGESLELLKSGGKVGRFLLNLGNMRNYNGSMNARKLSSLNDTDKVLETPKLPKQMQR